MINESLNEFMTGLIDYAGLFPPAKLPMAQAAEKFGAHLGAAESWMIGRFICPASKLEEFAKAFSSTESVGISVLGRGGATGAEFISGLRDDMAAVRAFVENHGQRFDVAVFETKLPDDLMTEHETRDVREIFQATFAILETQYPGRVRPFLEFGHRELWPTALRYLLRFLDYKNNFLSNDLLHPGVEVAGFKLRCGGVVPEAFPSVEEVALAISICRNQQIAMKLTAGLHHPVRHFNEGVGCKMHGFLNVVGAVLLAWEHDLKEEEIARIVAEEDPAAFTFTNEGFAWRELAISAGRIPELRQYAIASYGSCSFEEPVDDLRELGLLPHSN